jgi:arylsulfatase A-like enzyme
MKKRIFIIAAFCLIGITAAVLVAVHRHREIRHIILISIDTCRADHLSCYGYPRETTPNLDALAAQATRFENTFAPVPMTLPAHSSMLTGMIPPSHGVHHNIGYQLAPSGLTLAEILRGRNFKTGAIISAFVLDKQFGLSQGFDTYNDTFAESRMTRFGKERRGDEATRFALDWLDRSGDDKSFLFLHYYDLHEKYEPPEPFASEFSDDPYAGELSFVDHCIGQVIQKLKDMNRYDSTLLIITGDHGEMLGEHGEEEHSYFVYQSAIHVPLIVKVPGQKTGCVISQKTGLVDIVPTICSLLKIDAPSGIQGCDLSPMLYGKGSSADERVLYVESTGPNRIGASSLLAVIQGKWKYIQAPRPELYDLDNDPGEEHNLVEQEPRRARILQDRLKEALEQSVREDTNSGLDLDAESIRRLESLGYVAGKADGQMGFDQSGDDPKDYIHVFTQFNKALALRDEHEYEKAEEILVSLIPERPDFFEIYMKLAEIGMVQGDYDQAIVYYRRANILDLDKPLPDDLLNNLAWLEAARPRLPSRDVNEAVLYAKTSCEKTNYSDPNALDTLAVAYAAAGDFSAAVETALKAYGMAVVAKDFVFARKISSRLELFKQSKPYIEE